ncbi:hypothetical protein ABPG72_018814 [Tetrahymena utriculariae]
MNHLSHFLKQSYATQKMFNTPVIMSSIQILENKMRNSTWFNSIFSHSFFKKPIEKDIKSFSQLQIQQLTMQGLDLIRSSNSPKLNIILLGDIPSSTQLSFNSESLNSMQNKQNLIKIASRNNSTVKHFLKQQVQYLNNNTNNSNGNIQQNSSSVIISNKQLQQQLQYNIISTKEFHQQKKNYTKVKAFLKEFMLLLKVGTIDTYKDSKWYFKLLMKKKKTQMTGYEVRQSMRIRSDLFKIVPFSFFVIVPAAELLLPFYLLLFPNAMPSQYTFDYTYDQYIQSLEDNQASAHEQLAYKLKNHLMEKCNVSVDHFLHSDTYKQAFFKNYKNFESENLDFNKFTSEELITVCKFLGMEVITGTYIISKIANILINTPIWLVNIGCKLFKKEKKFGYSKFSIDLNFGPFEVLKRQLLLVQIKRHLKLLRLQDQAFFKMGFHDIVGHRITDFARERGITTISCYETLKAVIANEWVNVNINRKFNNNAMIWYSIMQYDFLRNANNDMN